VCCRRRTQAATASGSKLNSAGSASKLSSLANGSASVILPGSASKPDLIKAARQEELAAGAAAVPETGVGLLRRTGGNSGNDLLQQQQQQQPEQPIPLQQQELKVRHAAPA
jgi:hypothetical protein